MAAPDGVCARTSRAPSIAVVIVSSGGGAHWVHMAASHDIDRRDCGGGTAARRPRLGFAASPPIATDAMTNDSWCECLAGFAGSTWIRAAPSKRLLSSEAPGNASQP